VWGPTRSAETDRFLEFLDRLLQGVNSGAPNSKGCIGFLNAGAIQGAREGGGGVVSEATVSIDREVPPVP
jgi:hypothetical protein